MQTINAPTAIRAESRNARPTLRAVAGTGDQGPESGPGPADSPRVKGASVNDPKACAHLLRALERAELAILAARHAAEATGIVDAWISVEAAGEEIQIARRRLLAREE